VGRDNDIGAIARDLHDGPIQDVYASMLRITHLARSAAEPLRTELMEVAALHSRTIAHMRDLCGGRTLYSGDDRNLRDVLGDVIRDASIALGFDPIVSIDPAVDSIDDERLRADVSCALRECLSNVARHSRADWAEILVSLSDGQLILRVADNGKGIDKRTARGNGLNNLHDRGTRHGGSFVVTARAGGGTIVTWTVDASNDQYGSTGGPDGSVMRSRVAAV